MHGGTMMLVHTEVPPQLERRGFASMLVHAAFDYARENGLDVLPVCSYVSAWARVTLKSSRCWRDSDAATRGTSADEATTGGLGPFFGA